jgi:NTE family protein
VIGSRQPVRQQPADPRPPNLADQFGFMLDSLFMEGLQSDLERLARINALLGQYPPDAAPFGMRRVETLVVLPQSDPAQIALNHRMTIPGSLRAFLRILGATRSRGGKLLSFMLFEANYTRELIALGERDAEAQRAEIAGFLKLDCK